MAAVFKIWLGPLGPIEIFNTGKAGFLLSDEVGGEVTGGGERASAGRGGARAIYFFRGRKTKSSSEMDW